jgi:hypothetical protein
VRTATPTKAGEREALRLLCVYMQILRSRAYRALAQDDSSARRVERGEERGGARRLVILVNQ